MTSHHFSPTQTHSLCTPTLFLIQNIGTIFVLRLFLVAILINLRLICIYSHASLSFTNAKRVFKVLDMDNLELLGKKIYAVPAHQSLMADFPWVCLLVCVSLYPVLIAFILYFS